MSKPLTVGIVVSPGYLVCDIVGPQTVLGIQPDSEIHLLWKNRETVNGYPTFPTVPTTSFADCPAELDVLAVGGMIPDVQGDPEVIAFFKDAASRAKHIIAVCDGALLAGTAGLLKGRRATTNFHILDLLPEVGATPVGGGEVVRHGNLWTAGPATGSYEAALLVLAELRGEEAARRAELDIEYAPHPPFGTGSPALAGPEMTKDSLERLSMMNLGARAVLDRLREQEISA
ncbi:dihydroxy-acid dehydratase [Streptomyces camponoticapitis]|uniref:Dihydroxy-acid dehydratase n=1 Tax=Streptomyces camponoticapitis TaxID=1616125 RepID=A0ABQ2EWC5_9ACTN|nr:DJ-1/PfpI family protein [Streptomyces camponoticapitis]GGK27667.1 dihydroxy-acid dehydratase [Streptomyces camponoticapitis]